MKDVTFRLLTFADIPAMEEILTVSSGRFEPKAFADFLAVGGDLAFGAVVRDRIIGLIYGYTLCRPDGRKPQFFAYSVDVHPDFQSKGIGSAFFQYAVDWCRENGYSEVFVSTDRGNPRACRVYEKAGGKSEHTDEVIYVIEFKEQLSE